jgi:hypothetical protein
MDNLLIHACEVLRKAADGEPVEGWIPTGAEDYLACRVTPLRFGEMQPAALGMAGTPTHVMRVRPHADVKSGRRVRLTTGEEYEIVHAHTANDGKGPHHTQCMLRWMNAG